MQRERQKRDDLFGMGDPFGDAGGFGTMPRLFGGKDPFDDPFFTRPFGGGIFEPTAFEHPGSGGTAQAFRANPEKAVVIQELGSDDEDKMDEDGNNGKHIGCSQEPDVEHPDDDFNVMKDVNVSRRSDNNRVQRTEPAARTFSFQTSKVTYGGVNGAYYTSTRTRRAGNDGVVVEESKEADTTTGQATHRVSRGIHDKGHSLTRKLNADGKVETMQTLHNLSEDDLTSFEEAWKGNGLSGQFDTQGTTGLSRDRPSGMATSGVWALPSIDGVFNAGVRGPDVEARSSSSGGGTKKVVRINIE